MQLLAQTVPDLNVTTMLVAYGPMGLMLAWFAFRTERSLSQLAHRIDGMTKALLVDIISRDSTGSHGRREAQKMLDRAEERDAAKEK